MQGLDAGGMVRDWMATPGNVSLVPGLHDAGRPEMFDAVHVPPDSDDDDDGQSPDSS